MGSDLAMDPPRPDRYRAKWEDNICIVERMRDGIYGRETAGWHVVWRGIPTPDVKKAFEAMGFRLPQKPLTPEKSQSLLDDIMVLYTRLNQELDLAQSYSGDPDPGGTKMLAKVVESLSRIIKEIER